MAADTLARLGERLVAAVVERYDPAGSGLALALHPGQPIADGVVQDGVVNELRVSQWLADQYDYPMRLRVADGTPLPTSTLGGITAKAAYLATVPWAVPGVGADSPAFPRISALIAAARRDLGANPEALPLGCEPTDFAVPGSDGWHVFETTITVERSAPDRDPGAGPSTEPGCDPYVDPHLASETVPRLDPDLWRLHAVDPGAPDDPPPVDQVMIDHEALITELVTMPRERLLSRVRERAEVIDVAIGPSFADLVAAPGFATLSRAGVIDDSPVVTGPLWCVVGAAAGEGTAAAPTTITPPETVGDDLHVRLEYCLLTVTRRVAGTVWWHPQLLAEDAWYVPGMRRGDLVREGTDDGVAHCLPVALLVVRDVAFRGRWTAGAVAAMDGAVTAYLGPFRTTQTIGPDTATEQIAVLGGGIQVIGELCAPLAPLPPMSDPAEHDGDHQEEGASR